jgi:hypothetical protein
MVIEVFVPKFQNQKIEMNKLIIVINILLTFLLVGCTDLGVYIEEKKGGKYIKKLEMKDCINIPQLLLICY